MMKRAIAVLMIFVMDVAMMGMAVAEPSREKMAGQLVDLSKQIMEQVLEIYKQNGELSDGNIQLAYSYFKLYLDSMRILGLERVYPAAVYSSNIPDVYASMEEVLDGDWVKFVEGTGDREKFQQYMMTFIEVILKEKED